MERVTISMSDEFAAELAAFMEGYHYENRSEAVRDLARLGLQRAQIDHGMTGQCVATLSYVFNHRMRELSRRLAGVYDAHHELQVARTHIHLDHDNYLEVAILRGGVTAVREFCKDIIAERGVRHGQVSFVPVTIEIEAHAHEGSGQQRKHAHMHTHPAD
jgi:CopG family transcriptional regulator, nickel-responsive regulator